MSIPIINEKQFLENIKSRVNPFFEEYYAFYSSWAGGIINNPSLMLLPIDDHMVHRGDGVFEAMKAEGRAVYLMDEHLHRLFTSAERIELKSPFNPNQMKEVILETLRSANQDNAMIRLYLSRGPGNFSVNPYDSVASQFYVVVSKLVPPSPEKYEKGVVIGKSAVPVKPSWMAQVKSCNYLPNVLMKKEAVDRGLDFVIGVDTQGNITESATENIMIVDKHGVLTHPVLDQILKGTTMIRTCQLAHDNSIPVQVREISVKDLESAQEVLITGTSLNVLPVAKFEGVNINDGKPGPLTKKLNTLLLHDIKTGKNSVAF
jgi:branched-chain amino acid aminotransferase